ncbi:MAG: hypothetical protein K2X27_21840 [Candidatus Obscuribacterales bacterium]|nr:hypothetical protein [Candidatus Obscuribacterales bacterium]
MKKAFAMAAITAAFGVSISSALAGPLMLGAPLAMPVSPKVLSAPVSIVPLQTRVLNSYRQFRAFWVSRAIVR